MAEEVVWQIVFTIKESVDDVDLEESDCTNLGDYIADGKSEHPLDLLEELMAADATKVTWTAYTDAEAV